MHGLIFTGFRQYTWTNVADHAEAIWAGLPHYTMTEAYPDEAFTALVSRTTAATGMTQREVLVDFGRFTGFWVFRVMRGDYYKESPGTRAFLLDVEARIHETVRASTPDASPPRLHVMPLGDVGVSISYTSERRLCALLEGLVHGVADYYGERFDVEQPLCMHRGDAACSFVVTQTNGG